ncbi:MAG: hypothetical protein HY815_23540 [Candidatus Riflebacteria bacterium]|nr:hypothetical protein [Candidatus Riflebacteria bacterium]
MRDLQREVEVVGLPEGVDHAHVSRPEIDLPPGTDDRSDKVYTQGRENFKSLLREAPLTPNDR